MRQPSAPTAHVDTFAREGLPPRELWPDMDYSVLPELEGRISLGCVGIYKDEHVEAWRRVVAFVHANSKARIGMQIAHSGRKGSCTLPWEGDRPLASGGWEVLAPSPIAFDDGWPVPRKATRAETAVGLPRMSCTFWR